MPAERQYYVYMLASRTRRLYVGMTNDLERRVWQHQTRANDGFTSQYNIERLVWYESTSQVLDAIAREKQVKSWHVIGTDSNRLEQGRTLPGVPYRGRTVSVRSLLRRDDNGS